jgi:photosystem II stability/assembly factor-like uncharacterized protein
MRFVLLAAALTLTATATAHAQFELQDSHTTASFRGIHSIGNGIAWASGTEGTILRTTDEGKTWQRCASPPDAEKLDFRGIQAFDQNTAIVMSSGKGDLSRLYKTTDACKTWELVFTNPDKEGFWDVIQFLDRKRGYLLGDPVNDSFRLWNTEDSGSTWHNSHYPNFRANPVTQSAFAASNSALWAADTSDTYLAFGSGGTAGATFYSRYRFRISEYLGGEGGFAYQVPVGNKTESSGIFSLCFRHDEDSGNVGIAVGGDYLKPDDSAVTAAYTNDSRKPWTAAQTPPHGYRSSVAYDPTTKTWITVGPNGTDISRDDGRNWTALRPGPQDQPDADKNWNALSFPFVVGPKGRIGKLRADTLKH